MKQINKILNEFDKYPINREEIKNLTPIQEKDGIYVYRFSYHGNKYVIKYFENKEFRREIFYYQLLNKLDVPTIKVYDYNTTSLILEDINDNHFYRLGKKEDLSDPKVAEGLIKWYKTFHQKSKAYLKSNPIIMNSLYNEYNLVTKDVIMEIMIKTSSEKYSYWKPFLDEFDTIKKLIKRYINCLTYNDFYYTNFIVSNDKEEVIMYDYNLLGKGFVYSDVRNVLSSLEGDAKALFEKQYQDYHPIEKKIDEVFSVLFCLHEAYNKEKFPNWAIEEQEKIHNGILEKNIKLLLNLMY